MAGEPPRRPVDGASGPPSSWPPRGRARAADRALEAQRRLNDAATLLKASRDLNFEVRNLETSPILGPGRTARGDPRRRPMRTRPHTTRTGRGSAGGAGRSRARDSPSGGRRWLATSSCSSSGGEAAVRGGPRPRGACAGRCVRGGAEDRALRRPARRGRVGEAACRRGPQDARPPRPGPGHRARGDRSGSHAAAATARPPRQPTLRRLRFISTECGRARSSRAARAAT